MNTPTFQATTGTGADGQTPGACLPTAIAYITGTPAADVPHFVHRHMHSVNKTIAELTDDDWLSTLYTAVCWLEERGYGCPTVNEPVMPSLDLLGKPVVPHLALVMAGDAANIPHIIVVDQRWVQMFNPNPLDTQPYTSADVVACMAVTKR